MKRIILLAALALLIPWAGCARPLPPERPRPRPTLPVATRVIPPQPRPTVAPLDIETRAGGIAGLPAAPVIEPARTLVVTEYQDDCRWMGDVLLRWRHANPPAVDYYVVQHSLDAPYAVDDVEGVTTARRYLADAPGQDFVYNVGPPGQPSGCVGVDIMGRVDTWTVTACNRIGCSEPSGAVGVVTYSLEQGAAEPPW